MLYEIRACDISNLVYELALRANIILPDDVKAAVANAAEEETDELAAQVLRDILKNSELALKRNMPICQDCGLAVVFLDIGQEVSITGGNLEEAVNIGVKRAYKDGFLRKSVVRDPLFDRKNTNDNTPAVIHTRITDGNHIKITVAPKGMGSENASRLYMLKPSDGVNGVIDSVVKTISETGPNPCPPIVIGIGIGGNFETVTLAAKKALLTKIGVRHNIKEYALLELEILKRVNELEIGPGGYGGHTTALDVHINTLPTHIAGMPVAVNISCHALRHAEGTIEGSASCD